MRIMHICYGTPTSSAGGVLFYKQNGTALSELGHEVHLLVVAPDHELPADLARRMTSVGYADPIQPSPRSIDHLLARIFRSETLPFRFPDWQGLRQQVLAAVARIRPECIWADWIGTLLLLPTGIPVVYGHLDFIYQLQLVRSRLRQGRIRRPDALSVERLKALEFNLCRKVNAVASVSKSHINLFNELGVTAEYLPVVGDAIPTPAGPLPDSPRAFLLGRSNTAMNASRRSLRSEIWPLLEQRKPPLEWHQVGEVPASKDGDWRWLEDHFTIHGFVKNLETVLRPGDLNVVPYRDDTGFRAKFATAAGYGLVNIGYRETYACAGEFELGTNCLAADSMEHFVDLLDIYARDLTMRKRLANASRALYEARFTLKTHLPTYQRLLDAAVLKS